MSHAFKLMLIAGVCALLLVPAAQAAPSAQSEEDFFASLATTPEPAMAADTTPDFAATRGGSATESACSASANCYGAGSNLSCSGSSTCSAADRNCGINQRGFVKCDGATTYCSQPCPCSASTLCNDGSGWISCNGTGTSCYANTGCSVTCNGTTYYCGSPGAPRQGGSSDDTGNGDNIKACPAV